MENNVSKIALARVKKLKYAILAGHDAAEEATNLHNGAYRLWKESWRETYKELKTEAKLKADDFTRQDIVSALFHGEEAVSLLLHTIYNLNLDAVRDHSYLAGYPADVVARLRAEGSLKVMSMEYLTLSPRWRRSEVGVPIAEVIIGLSVKIVETLGVNAVAVTRVDRSVNDMFAGFGATLLAPNLKMHNVAVDLMKLEHSEIRPNPDPAVNDLIKSFWRNRNDQVGIHGLAAIAVKKAA